MTPKTVGPLDLPRDPRCCSHVDIVESDDGLRYLRCPNTVFVARHGWVCKMHYGILQGIRRTGIAAARVHTERIELTELLRLEVLVARTIRPTQDEWHSTEPLGIDYRDWARWGWARQRDNAVVTSSIDPQNIDYEMGYDPYEED